MISLFLKKKFFGIILILFLVFLIGMISMPREEYQADPMAVRCETVSLINNGSLEIPAALAAQFGERGQFFVENTAKQGWYCKYGILNSFMYVPVLLLQKWWEGSLEYTSSSRVIYLNVFNILLAMATALYLYLIASRYTRSGLVILLFILSAFYGTYWWNYLRAQNSEIYQTLFLLGFYYHLVTSSSHSRIKDNPATRWKHQLLAGLFLGTLILVKMVYVILAPLAVIFLLADVWDRHAPFKNAKERQEFLKSSVGSFFCFSLPIILSLGVLLWVNAYKFGAPLESGYGQWKERGKPIFSGPLFSGLAGFLFDSHYSIFLYFPILIFALWGYRYFFRQYKLETFFVLSLGLVLLGVNSKLLEWRAGWAYGPRYMLSILPLLSLPFLHVLELLISNRRKMGAIIASIVIALCLLSSFQLQCNLNALPFFAYFRLQGLFEQLHNPEIDRYFAITPFGIINQDFLRWKQGKNSQLLERASQQLSPEGLNRFTSIVRFYTGSNYYFWPDP